MASSMYSVEEFLGINKEIRDITTRYKTHKNEMSLGELQDNHDDLAVLMTQLMDAGADIQADYLQAAVVYRAAFLRERDAAELTFNTTKNPATGKPWTSAFDRARYAAELATEELLKEANTLKAIANKSYRMGEFAKQTLISMGRRIAILKDAWKHDLEMQEIAAKNNPLQHGGEADHLPATSSPFKSNRFDDGFGGWIENRNPTQSLDELENEARELQELVEDDSHDDPDTLFDDQYSDTGESDDFLRR